MTERATTSIYAEFAAAKLELEQLGYAVKRAEYNFSLYFVDKGEFKAIGPRSFIIELAKEKRATT